MTTDIIQGGGRRLRRGRVMGDQGEGEHKRKWMTAEGGGGLSHQLRKFMNAYDECASEYLKIGIISTFPALFL